jgi:hypothetical protein
MTFLNLESEANRSLIFSRKGILAAVVVAYAIALSSCEGNKQGDTPTLVSAPTSIVSANSCNRPWVNASAWQTYQKAGFREYTWGGNNSARLDASPRRENQRRHEIQPSRNRDSRRHSERLEFELSLELKTGYPLDLSLSDSSQSDSYQNDSFPRDLSRPDLSHQGLSRPDWNDSTDWNTPVDLSSQSCGCPAGYQPVCDTQNGMICAPDHTLHNSRTQIWSWHSGSKNFRYDGHYTGYSNGVRTRYGQSSSSYQLGQQVPDDISLQNHCSGQISNIGQTCQPGSNVCGNQGACQAISPGSAIGVCVVR